AYSVGYGIKVTSRASVGAAFKLIDQNLDSEHATAAALDAGLHWSGNGARLAAGARNLGTKVKFRDSADPLPAAFYAGAALGWGTRWTLALDVRTSREDRAQLSAGGEYCRPFESLTGCLRAGVNTAHMDAGGLGGAALGGGIGTGSLRFDFAWTPFGELGSAFRYSLRVRF
ncbi:MAG: hypothetical protein HY553_21435, partial [Elusimicrobia bacterium]|nr:hypothetical protein [Elusimicrobiota bacterium]